MTNDQVDEPTERLEAFFEAHNDEFLKYERVKPERRLHARPDLNAFLLLDKLVPGDTDLISAAMHDEIFFGVEPYQVMKAASEEDLLDLIRCGFRLPKGTDSLGMFA